MRNHQPEYQLKPFNQKQPEPLMTREQYAEFSKKFHNEVRPTLDEQTIKRYRSEIAARKHLITD